MIDFTSFPIRKLVVCIAALSEMASTKIEADSARSQRVLAAVRSINAASPKYTARDIDGDGKKDTMCNWFVADVAAAIGLSVNAIPTNDQAAVDGNGYKPVSANRLNEYFHQEAAEPNGHWRMVSQADAATAASQDKFVVASLKNGQGHGHVAIILPGSTGKAIRIAQAGRVNGNDMALAEGFGKSTPTFFVFKEKR